jgi:hypothetical protein
MCAYEPIVWQPFVYCTVPTGLAPAARVVNNMLRCGQVALRCGQVAMFRSVLRRRNHSLYECYNRYHVQFVQSQPQTHVILLYRIRICHLYVNFRATIEPLYEALYTVP